MNAGVTTGPAPATPRFARLAIGFALPSDSREAVLGDLEESFRQRSRTVGAAPARSWYRAQAFRSVWPALSLHADAKGIGRLLGALVVGIATMWIVGDVILVSSRAGYAALFPAAEAPDGVLRLTYLASMVPTAVLAGYLATRSGGNVGRLAAVSLAAILVLPVVIAPFLQHGSEPAWHRALWVLVAPAAIVLGASLPDRRRRRVG